MEASELLSPQRDLYGFGFLIRVSAASSGVTLICPNLPITVTRLRWLPMRHRKRPEITTRVSIWLDFEGLALRKPTCHFANLFQSHP